MDVKLGSRRTAKNTDWECLKTRARNIWPFSSARLQTFGEWIQDEEKTSYITVKKRSQLRRMFFSLNEILSFSKLYCFRYVPELLTDDITQAVVCAKLIYRLQGFSAWRGWTKKCKNRHLPDVIHCLNETSTTDPPVYSVIINWVTELYSGVVYARQTVLKRCVPHTSNGNVTWNFVHRISSWSLFCSQNKEVFIFVIYFHNKDMTSVILVLGTDFQAHVNKFRISFIASFRKRNI
jgi:hypothetical protein